MEKERECQKNIYFCFIDYGEAFDCVNHNKLWKILKEKGIPDFLTCSLILPYLSVSQESCTWVKKQQLEVNMEQWTGSQLGEECD